MSVNFQANAISDNEFIALMALLMSMVALALDTMLPALAVIGTELGVTNANDNQLIIAFIFLGIAIGQLLYGPLSDSTGRKPAIYLGIVIFILGCLLSLFAHTFSLMLAGRLLQGLGIAGPRNVSVALVRDKYEGREMAKIMSFIMTLFILVPVVAPALGQGIMIYFHWRGIFALLILLGLISFCWLAFRQPETLLLENRVPLSLSRILSATWEVYTNRMALGYTLMAGFISGMFLAFLSTSPQILQQQYQLGHQFPIYFALIALAVGLASFINGKIVMRYGMQLLCHRSLYIFFILSVLYWFPAYSYNGHPPLWTFISFLLISFFFVGILWGNLNALAMQPLGHIAGIGAAVVGSLSTLISVPIGVFIGIKYDGTVLPLILGFILCALSAIVLLIWTEQGSGEKNNLKV